MAVGALVLVVGILCVLLHQLVLVDILLDLLIGEERHQPVGDLLVRS